MPRKHAIQQPKKGFKDIKSLNFSSYSQKEKRKIKREIDKINFFSIPQKRTQIFTLIESFQNHRKVEEKYSSFSFYSRLFSLPPQNIRVFFKQGEKERNSIEKNREISIGRPKIVDEDTTDQLIDHIASTEAQNSPLTLSDAKKYLLDTHSIDVSEQTVRNIVKDNGDRLMTIKTSSIDRERYNITSDIIAKHFEELEEFIGGIHPLLLINADESSLEGKPKKEKKRVIITTKSENSLKYHPTQINNGHITFMCSICSDLTLLPPLIIQQQKSVHADITKFGFPGCALGRIAQSKKGWITKELMMTWANDILIPEIKKRRRELGSSAVAGLIMDGHSTHHSEELGALLKRNNVRLYIIPPHTSHILQPLDLLIFSLWKTLYKKIRFSDDFSKQSERILRGVKALWQAANPLDIRSAFLRAAVDISWEINNPVLSIDHSRSQRIERSVLPQKGN